MRFGLAALAIGLALGAACDGGGGSTNVAGGGIGGTGISSGSVTGFGSYFVTGTEWALAPTGVVEIDGRASGPMRAYDERDLRLGMYLRVDGERSEDGLTASSTYIRYDEAIEGAVEQAPLDVDTDRKQLTILGQSVLIDDGITVFDGTSFASLAAGDVVEVSGPVDSDGQVLATEVEFKGPVTNLGGGAFDVGPVTVHFDCSSTTDCGALPSGGPADGMLVEIEGTQSQAGATPEVEAGVVRPYTPFASQVGDVDNLEVEGVIDDFAGPASFTVNGIAVDASAAQLDPTDASLADGVYVEAEGNRTGGVLRARSLELRDGAAFVAARIASGGLDRAAQNEIVLLAEGSPGQPDFQELVVQVDGATRIEDRSAAGDPDLNLSELLVGDFLEVRGVVVAGTGRIRASEVRREDIGDVRLRGPVASIDTDPGDGSVGYSALGIFVELVQGTTNVPGGDVDAFLAGLAIGDLLEARDDQDGSEERFDIADDVAAP